MKQITNRLSFQRSILPTKYISITALFFFAVLSALALTSMLRQPQAQAQGVPIVITKLASADEAGVGETVRYTIEIANNSTAQQTFFINMTDTLPSELEYVTGSLSSTVGTANYDPDKRKVSWFGDLPAGQKVYSFFDVFVSDSVAAPPICNTPILNTAFANVFDSQQNQFAIQSVPIAIKWVCPDLGDAPDSTNHSTITMTAYTGVPARYPTVYDPATGLPPGPRHRQPKADAWLGTDVSSERDADLLFDFDGLTNIAPSSNMPDRDDKEDGIVVSPTLKHCTATSMVVRVNVVGGIKTRYINSWFDWNRDGDWEDSVQGCVGALSDEWATKNFTTTLGNGTHVITLPMFLPIDLTTPNDRTLWMRLSLSDVPAPVNPSTTKPDGRGPGFGGYRFGETEDYLVSMAPSPVQEPKLSITKTANVTQVVPGGQIEYTIIVNNTGGPASGVLVYDQIPPLTTYVVGTVTSTLPTATYNGGFNRIEWNGNIPASSSVTIKFKVNVSPDAKCDALIGNVGRIINPATGQTVQAAGVGVQVVCPPTQDKPGLLLTKAVMTSNTPPVTTTTFPPGGSAVYILTLSTTDGLSHTVNITDNMPIGLIAISATASSGVVNIISGGMTVVWNGIVGPANSPVVIKIYVRAKNQLECNVNLVNVGQWQSQGHTGQSNPAFLQFICADLGDAPDSTNHYTASMTAYPAVQAKYPTVFAVSSPERGPRHDNARPFHLGQGVTAEREADIGYDADGVNNIRPTSDQPNLDKADDGLVASSLNWKDCQQTKFLVVVSIDPSVAALLASNNGIGYLNAWLDSNRDGDWADRFDCAGATGVTTTALEHIVIDFPVNVNALGPGLHTLSVNTSVPVKWDAQLANKPYWLRLTLSDTPSNKPFVAGTQQYGDGRGPNNPFRLGETEDWILLGEVATPTSDSSVNKRGEIWPDFDPLTQTRRWVLGWIVNYSNAGPGVATNVHVIDTFSPPQTLIAEHSIPIVPHTQSGNTLDYNVGTLPPGGSGLVIIRTSVAWNTTPGTVLTNTANVTSNNDGNTANNTSVATATVPILPPLITSPLAGSTCSTTLVISGLAQPGVTVDVYIDGALVASVPTNANGEWTHTATSLSSGSHSIHVVARLGALTSDPSPTVTVIVDPTLFWDPISLRFVDDAGHVIIPSGRLDESGWSIFLRPGHTYTVSLRVCCDDPNAVVTIDIDTISVTLTDLDGDHIYTGTFTIPAGGRVNGTVRVCVTCHLIRRCSDGTVLIDPEGNVYDISTGQLVPGAVVACMEQNGSNTNSFTQWNAAVFGQVNPQTVGNDAYFSFFTPPGTFRLDVTKPGYQPFTSPNLVVVDAPVHYDVYLTPNVTQNAGAQIAMTSQGFEPPVVRVPLGAVVEWINTETDSRGSKSSTTTTTLHQMIVARANAANDWDSGLLQTGESYKKQFNTLGTFAYQDPSNPNFTATIIVEKRVYLPLVSR